MNVHNNILAKVPKKRDQSRGPCLTVDNGDEMKVTTSWVIQGVTL